MNKYYVYLHKIGDNVVYVGRGSGVRIHDKHKRTLDHLSVWSKLTFFKVKENLSLDDAVTLEQELLDFYWNSGQLFNVHRNSGKVKHIVYSDVLSKFYYDENSASKLSHGCDKFCGEFNSVKVAEKGTKAGYLHKVGYYVVSFNNKVFLAHRLVYSLVHKIDLPVDLVVDHIDGDRIITSITNLRLVIEVIILSQI